MKSGRKYSPNLFWFVWFVWYGLFCFRQPCEILPNLGKVKSLGKNEINPYVYTERKACQLQLAKDPFWHCTYSVPLQVSSPQMFQNVVETCRSTTLVPYSCGDFRSWEAPFQGLSMPVPNMCRQAIRGHLI